MQDQGADHRHVTAQNPSSADPDVRIHIVLSLAVGRRRGFLKGRPAPAPGPRPAHPSDVLIKLFIPILSA